MADKANKPDDQNAEQTPATPDAGVSPDQIAAAMAAFMPQFTEGILQAVTQQTQASQEAFRNGLLEEIKNMAPAQPAPSATGGLSLENLDPSSRQAVEAARKAVEEATATKEQLQRQMQAEKLKYEQQVNQINRSRAIGLLEGHFMEKGLSPERAKSAVARLVFDDRLEVSEDGLPSVKLKNAFGLEERKEGSAGVEEWLKTEAGKDFLPPINVSGTGASTGSTAGSGSAFDESNIPSITCANDLFKDLFN